MRGRHLYLVAFILCIALISYRDMKQQHKLPFPGRLIKTGLVFVLIDIFALVQEELAGVIAIGFTLAMVVNPNMLTTNVQAITNQTTQAGQTNFMTPTEQPPSATNFIQL